MKEKQNAALGTAPLGRLMLKFALPCTVSLLVGALYNIVDQIFIGWGVGYLGNGATNVVFPLTVLALGLAVMIGDGACSYVSARTAARSSPCSPCWRVRPRTAFWTRSRFLFCTGA